MRFGVAVGQGCVSDSVGVLGFTCAVLAQSLQFTSRPVRYRYPGTTTPYQPHVEYTLLCIRYTPSPIWQLRSRHRDGERSSQTRVIILHSVSHEFIFETVVTASDRADRIVVCRTPNTTLDMSYTQYQYYTRSWVCVARKMCYVYVRRLMT